MNEYDRFILTGKTLIKKKLVPHHTLSFLTDPNNIQAAWNEYQDDTIKEFVCPKCGIYVKGARTWFRQHIKMHTEKARYSEKIKEDDADKFNAPVYFE